MTDKLEALSQPVFEIEVSGNTWLNCSAEKLTPTERADFSDWPDGINKLYSQEYVTALLAENAELKASLSEWEDCKHDGATYHDMSGRERCGRCGADL